MSFTALSEGRGVAVGGAGVAVAGTTVAVGDELGGGVDVLWTKALRLDTKQAILHPMRQVVASGW